MTAVTLILVATSLPMCFAITHASRAGATSWRGKAVWGAEAIAAALIRWARGQRDYAAWRESRARRAA